MATSPTPQSTDFTRDIMGRYICNGFDEALQSHAARPFDVVVIGGGSFGAAFAQHLLSQDKMRSHRILVLEAGPLAVPEHVQNLPMLGINAAGPTSIADLRNTGQFDKPRNEVWGLPWHSDTPFSGLAYCIGGRSLFWGGWSPQLLDGEMLSPAWPASTVADLKARYFAEAAGQIGTDETNDFIDGPLHRALRQILLDGITANKVANAVPLSQIPETLKGVDPADKDLMKLEAPLAVQSHTRPGCFPFNKFSSVQLLMKAARIAQAQSGGDDNKKRLMIVPNCHTKRLVTSIPSGGNQAVVTGVDTNLGFLSLPAGAVVVLAAGTIECTRLALVSFGATPGAARMGRNLMAHLRTNLHIRVPRESLPPGLPAELQTSALFVKGRHPFADGTFGHFHLQITASGLGAVDTDSEAELFKKIPDIDTFAAMRAAQDSHVVITIRGIGEMQPDNPESFVRLDSELDEFGVPRAFVGIADPRQPRPNESAQSKRDRELWEAMDKTVDDVAKVLAGNQPFQILGKNRDGLGTTHHEAGTLRMGDDPGKSVTDANGRFHDVANAYVAGPAVFPTIGSPNPMLTGVALARRLGDVLAPHPTAPEAPFKALFNGAEGTFKSWQMVGQGSFELFDGTLIAQPGNDLGLLYYTGEAFGDFILRLQFRLGRPDDNAGVFVRFRNPQLPVPDRNQPGLTHPYANKAWVAVHTGHEVQIDENARPDGLDIHRTGAIYDMPIGNGPGLQTYSRGPALQPGVWHEYEIEVIGNTYRVSLNGQQTTNFMNNDPFRGKSSEADPHSGFIGLQAHSGRVGFRNVRICTGPALQLLKSHAPGMEAAADIPAPGAPRASVSVSIGPAARRSAPPAEESRR